MILKKLKREYEKKGFVVYKNLISKSNLHEMNKSLGVFTKKYKAKTRKNMNLTNKKINSIHNIRLDLDKKIKKR